MTRNFKKLQQCRIILNHVAAIYNYQYKSAVESYKESKKRQVVMLKHNKDPQFAMAGIETKVAESGDHKML